MDILNKGRFHLDVWQNYTKLGIKLGIQIENVTEGFYDHLRWLYPIYKTNENHLKNKNLKHIY